MQLSRESLNIITDLAQQAGTKRDMVDFVGLQPLWVYFKEAERQMIALLKNEQVDFNTDQAESEFGLVLYALNHLLLPESTAYFRSLGMPVSAIESAYIQTDEAGMITIAPGMFPVGKKNPDGSLCINVPFAQLDPEWALSAVFQMSRRIGIIKDHPFIIQTEVHNPFEDRECITIAIIGDWGTGLWKDGQYAPPSKLVADSINAMTNKPDIVIHLGDVYYSGLKHEEARNLIQFFPTAKDDFNFTLNSNHEIYSGAYGYYKIALEHRLFRHHNGASYFAVRYKDWVLIGLDTAYFDTSFMAGKGALTSTAANTIQQDFIKSLNIGADQKIILFTHHHAIDYTGSNINQPLVGQVQQALGDHYPDYWYYGHIHSGTVFNDKCVIGNEIYATRYNTYPKLRCVGHSAIPVGEAEFSADPPEYYVKTKLPDPGPKQKLRVLNGFATIKLSYGEISETMYEVCPVNGLITGWES